MPADILHSRPADEDTRRFRKMPRFVKFSFFFHFFPCVRFLLEVVRSHEEGIRDLESKATTEKKQVRKIAPQSTGTRWSF